MRAPISSILATYLLFSENVHSELTMSRRLSEAALSIFTHFEPSVGELILNHGCWCAKLNPGSDQSRLGGHTVHGELDRICKECAVWRNG